jgi:predicted dehydrogenase
MQSPYDERHTVTAHPHPAPTTLRTGFAGLGQVGQTLLAAAARVPAIQPVAVQETQEALLPVAAGLARFTDYEAMLETAGLDAVVISTLTAYHVPYARMALARGIHVLLQPPLARTLPDAETLLEVAGSGPARLVLDVPWRYAPATAAARTALAAGRVGTLLSVQARFHNQARPTAAWMLDRDWAGGGVLLDQGGPLLDLTLYLLGGLPVSLHAAYLWREGRAPGRAVEDFATLLGAIGGVPLHCEVSWGAQLPRTAISVTLFGTAGTLVWHNQQGTLTDFAVRLGHSGGEEALASGPADLPAASLQAFAARCATATPHDLTPYRTVAAVLDEAYASGLASEGEKH